MKITVQRALNLADRSSGDVFSFGIAFDQADYNAAFPETGQTPDQKILWADLEGDEFLKLAVEAQLAIVLKFIAAVKGGVATQFNETADPAEENPS